MLLTKDMKDFISSTFSLLFDYFSVFSIYFVILDKYSLTHVDAWGTIFEKKVRNVQLKKELCVPNCILRIESTISMAFLSFYWKKNTQSFLEILAAYLKICVIQIQNKYRRHFYYSSTRAFHLGEVLIIYH